MKYYLSPVILTLVVLLSACRNDSDRQQSASSSNASAPDNEAVQSVMKEHIERTTSVQGTMTVRGTELAFDYLHDDVEARDGMLISCADFTTATGEVYDIDYYVDPSATQMEVTKVILHKKAGEPVNDVLWKLE